LYLISWEEGDKDQGVKISARDKRQSLKPLRCFTQGSPRKKWNTYLQEMGNYKINNNEYSRC
jgi:hypothetical protein